MQKNDQDRSEFSPALIFDLPLLEYLDYAQNKLNKKRIDDFKRSPNMTGDRTVGRNEDDEQFVETDCRGNAYANRPIFVY